MRVRLRPAYSQDELDKIYETPHRHDLWPDHRLRVTETIRLANDLGGLTEFPARVADLSCGDATIARRVRIRTAVDMRIILGDYAPGWEITGPIEKTIHRLEPVDLFICSETIEHLDDPDYVLRAIRHKASRLVLSTPLGETSDRNPEHYWGWDEAGVFSMLMDCGWEPVLHRTVTYRPEPGEEWVPAAYQLWGCK